MFNSIFSKGNTTVSSRFLWNNAHRQFYGPRRSTIFYVDGRRPGVDSFGKTNAGGTSEQRYYRYAVARFATFSNVMWDVTNEYRQFRDDAWDEKMGTLIKQWDSYDH